MSDTLDLKLPEAVSELLEPISPNSPAGVELNDQVKIFTLLSMEITKTPPNYQKCAEWASELLKKHSKHVGVTAWLALAWYRTEKLAGLKNGLLLLAALLERFADKTFPEKAEQRSKAIQFLNRDAVTKLFERETIDEKNAHEARETGTALQKLLQVHAEKFPGSTLTLSKLSRVIEKLVAAAQGFADQPLDDAQKIDPIDEVPVAADDKKTESSDEETPALQVPEDVLELLEPISPEAPTGLIPADDKTYFKLEREIDKLNFNADLCIEWATDLLKNRGKDLHVILALGIAWYRKEKRLTGLLNGFWLLRLALQRFAEKLHPLENAERQKAFKLLKRKPLAEWLQYEKITKENAAEALALQKIFQELVIECEKQIPDSKKVLHPIGEAIVAKAEAAANLLKPEEEENEDDNDDNNNEQPPPPPPKPPAIASDEDAWRSLKTAVLYFFEETSNGEKKLKATEDARIYGVSRLFRWGRLAMPPADNKVTKIEAPASSFQDSIKAFFSNKEWDKLIPRMELNFLNPDAEGVRYWLEGQRYVAQALEQKGGKALEAAVEVKFHLAKLLERLPDLPSLLFKDGKTLFADPETLKWIADEVKPLLGGAPKPEGGILPPVMGEDYEPINKEYEAASAELPENFELHAEAMQKAIAGDLRRKGRFLRSLNLANYCAAAKQYELAKALCSDLLQKIKTHQLEEWEPALCVAVWQAAYATNAQLLRSDIAATQKPDLVKQQTWLFEKIGALDFQRALQLRNALL